MRVASRPDDSPAVDQHPEEASGKEADRKVGVATRLAPEDIPAVLAKHRAMCWQIANNLRARNPNVELEDIHAEVQLAVVRAAGKFDPSRGLKFITYAYVAGYRAGALFCIRENNRGFHVPENYRGVLAPPVTEVNPDLDVARPEPERPPDVAANFWEAVTRRLPPRAKAMVLAKYRDGLRNVEIAERFGVSKQRVSQILIDTLGKLRKRAGLRKYVEDAA